VSHEVEVQVELDPYAKLEELDAQLVRETQRQGCPSCGGRLDRADFPRKPRGLPAEAEVFFERRYALCCSREGCRRRTLPPSVRFLGRIVYVALAVLAACLSAALSRRWQETRRIARWLGWWRGQLGRSRAFMRLRGHFASPVEVSALPASLAEQFGGRSSAQLRAILLLLAEPVRELSHEGWGRMTDPQRMALGKGAAAI